MKKVISVSMVIAMIFALSACSSAEYTETPVTVAVTDENGEVVTDAQGNTVTEVVTDENGNAKTETKKNITVKEGKTTTAAKNDSQNNNNNSGNGSNNSGSGNSGNNNSDSNNNNNNGNSGNNGNNNQGNNGSNNNDTPSKEDPTKPTEKPKKRDVTITVELPFYNKKETKLTLYYKVGNDKKFSEFEPVELVLDSKGNNRKQEFTIEDVKGEIYAYIEFEGIAITHNDVTIPASGENSDKGTITPVTGIEIMDGGED